MRPTSGSGGVTKKKSTSPGPAFSIDALSGNLDSPAWQAETDRQVADQSAAAKAALAKAQKSNTQHSMDVFGDFGNSVIGRSVNNLSNSQNPDLSPLTSDAGTTSMLAAFSKQKAAPASLSGTGGFAPAPSAELASANVPGFTLGPLPTLHMPTQDYNSYLAQAQKALDFAAVAQPYDQAIGQVTKDTGIAVGNIGSAAQGAQADIAAGSGLLQQTGAASNANAAAIEQALSQQQAASAQGATESNGSLAAALGTSGLQGQINSSAAQQNAAAQQYLASSTQNNRATTNANTSAQVADNQNYGRVVDAKATSDRQNAELAGEDAKAGIGLQKGQSLLAARQQAAAQAVTMQQNAMQNALGSYNAQLGGWQAMAGYGENQQQLAMAEKQFEANQLAATAGSEQNFYKNLQGGLGTVLQYGGTNPEVSGQLVQNAYTAAASDPYLQQLIRNHQFSLPPLTQALAQKYGLGG